MADSTQDRSAAIAQFCVLTGVEPREAEPYLASHGWDVSTATQNFFDDAGEPDEADSEPSSHAQNPLAQPEAPSSISGWGSRTLGGDSVPSRPVDDPPPQNAQSRQPKKKFASLRDFEVDGGGQGHGSGDEDSDRGQEYFTGGDKSGLAVHDPGDNSNRDNSMVQRLIDTARRAGGSRGQQEDAPTQRQSRFTGTGQTLGGDDTPSRTVPDLGTPNRPRPMVERTLHLWADGYSVDDGQLYRYDDPANEATLEMINRGAAPLELMNVEPGQDVDVKLIQHRGQNYVAPKPKYKPFAGGGQRLGSPTPGASSATDSSAGKTSGTISTGSSSASGPASVGLDESKPILTLQIRLGDGTQLRSRFNTSHTVGDVYSFVNRASSESTQRPYALMTTFPSKELSDPELLLGEMPELKRGGVVIQKWT